MHANSQKSGVQWIFGALKILCATVMEEACYTFIQSREGPNVSVDYGL
jgi:hypothetical protein